MRIAGCIASTAATALAVAAVLALGAFAVSTASGLKPAVVKSGSMEPMLHRGSLIFVKPTPAQELRVGDVITFENPFKKDGSLVTHRIKSIAQSNQGRSFITKGDNNNAQDPWVLKIRQDAGLQVYDVPYVGLLGFFVHTKLGYALLLAIPVLWLCIAALRRIWLSSDPAPEAV